MPKILIAEDDPSIRDLLTQILRLEGYAVEAHAEGAGALASLKAGAPDAVVLDLMMPNVDGLELLNHIRSEAATTTLPVVILTAKGDDATTWAGWSGGCDYYMTKPFEPDELMSTLARLVDAGATR
jgi:DNA-binding response OmpR family regulator